MKLSQNIMNVVVASAIILGYMQVDIKTYHEDNLPLKWYHVFHQFQEVVINGP